MTFEIQQRDPGLRGNETIENARALLPGWSDVLLNLFVEEWVDTGGDFALAMARVQSSPDYAAAFPGLVRDDGSLRFTNEQEYLAARTIFETSLEALGINPFLFGDTFVGLLEREVGVREMVARIETTYTRIIDSTPETIAFFARQFGLADLTPEAILAIALDPAVGDLILNRQISIAEIGGAAGVRDIDIDLDLVQRLVEVGIDVGTASETFGQAAETLPILNVLARRHNDPDDTFDINEFVGAQLLDDPFQRRRIRQLLARERSEFTEAGVFTTDREGTIRGLTLR